jgi:hypothetical protein
VSAAADRLIVQRGDAVGAQASFFGPLATKVVAPASRSDDVRDMLLERAWWARSLPRAARSELLRAVAWPLAVVLDGTVLYGTVVPDLRTRFSAPMRLPSGRTAPVVVSLGHLLEDDEYLLRRFGVRLSTAARLRVARSIAANVALLHRHGIAAGDVSHANIVVSLEGRHASAFLDSDPMLFAGRRVAGELETPGWTPPREQAWRLATPEAVDAYKLALVVLRLLTRSRTAVSFDEPRRVRPGVAVDDAIPSALREVVEDALSGPGAPQLADIADAIESALDAQPRPQPAPPPHAPAAPRPVRSWHLSRIAGIVGPLVVLLAVLALIFRPSVEQAIDAMSASTPRSPQTEEEIAAETQRLLAESQRVLTESQPPSAAATADPASAASDAPGVPGAGTTTEFHDPLLRAEPDGSIARWPRAHDAPGHALLRFYGRIERYGSGDPAALMASPRASDWSLFITSTLLKVYFIGRAHIHGHTARVRIYLVYRDDSDSVPFQCSAVQRTERLVLRHGRWLVDTPEPPFGQPVPAENCG